jgi:hypothetical protein
VKIAEDPEDHRRSKGTEEPKHKPKEKNHRIQAVAFLSHFRTLDAGTRQRRHRSSQAMDYRKTSELEATKRFGFKIRLSWCSACVEDKIVDESHGGDSATHQNFAEWGGVRCCFMATIFDLEVYNMNDWLGLLILCM